MMSTIDTAALTFAPSNYQSAIFSAFVAGERNILVQAVAGSGKTKTMEEALKLLRPQKVIALAFNRSIAEELQRRVPGFVTASTLNSVGHRTWMRHVGRVEVNGAKMRQIARNVIPFHDKDITGDCVALAIKAKVHGIVPTTAHAVHMGLNGLMSDTDENWLMIADRYGIDLPYVYDRHLSYARQILHKSVLDRTNIDFDDQLYMPIVYGSNFEKFDRVVVDEAQDLSDIQIEMILRMGRPSTRYMVVGDRQQSLYGFRGADSRAMDRLRETLDAIELPLSVTYRCGSDIVARAKAFVPQIEPRPNAPKGEVVEGGYFFDVNYQPGDLVVCRRNAPVITLAYNLMGKRVKCRVQGRDLAEGLLSLIRKLKARDVKDLGEKLTRWAEAQAEALRNADQEEKIEAMTDKVNTIRVIISHNEQAKTVVEIEKAIDDLFSGEGPCVLLSSVHRAKGLEADRVFVIDLDKGFKASKEEDIQTERNIKYVAITRAKNSLVLVSSDPKDRRSSEQPVA